MDARGWVIAVIGCSTDFVLASGGTFTALLAENGGLPSKVGVALAIVTGFVAAARRLQALVQLPPMANGAK